MPLWQSPWTPRPARRVREGTGVLEKVWVVERARAWTDIVGVLVLGGRGCFVWLRLAIGDAVLDR